MVSRISDPQVFTDGDPQLAMIVDLIKACHDGSDVTFMFPDLSAVAPATWRIPVDSDRALLFEWVDGFGAINIRLE